MLSPMALLALPQEECRVCSVEAHGTEAGVCDPPDVGDGAVALGLPLDRVLSAHELLDDIAVHCRLAGRK